MHSIWYITLYPLSFDDLSIVQNTSARSSHSRLSYNDLSVRMHSQDSFIKLSKFEYEEMAGILQSQFSPVDKRIK
ncbi:10094_t:CDS:2 [Funneliformis geosporum]|uniref:10094_t:CDS:1 n=1 Tax=Funneliformis geosporum TaxID=1117311 RepID=A0A9W4WY88_9GLOM|nr:10094_t:CDS:2 [Funneliformis geosporum]